MNSNVTLATMFPHAQYGREFYKKKYAEALFVDPNWLFELASNL